ncbi:MAG: cupin domain-containing protein, partial [Methylophilus sp.]
LIPDAPLRILSHFVSEQEWVLEPGDMLYLPPNVAHWGVAEDDDCMTYSIGFRAPAARELAVEFLDACRQEGLSDELYQDPELEPVSDAAAIDPAMVTRVSAMLQRLAWHPDELGPFLARYFTEPKAYVVFTPNRKLSLTKFTDQVRESGVTLDLQTQMLHWQGQYFINGEVIEVTDLGGHLNALANQRQLSAPLFESENAKHLLPWLRDMYLLGYLHLNEI